METIATFHKDLERRFQGNHSYTCVLPDDIQKLRIVLTYNKDKIDDIHAYMNKYQEELLPILTNYLEYPATLEEYEEFVKNMKTEIQLCLMMDSQFIGNVHKPGTKKEILLTKESSSEGCIQIDTFKTNITVIINVFQVIEEGTSYDVIVEGE